MPLLRGIVSSRLSLIAVVTVLFGLVLIVGVREVRRQPRHANDVRTTADNVEPIQRQEAAAPVYTYEVVREYPHDPKAFTQGLIYHDGFLYESTGRHGQSSLRKVRLETGEVIERRDVSDDYFAEGLTEWRGNLVQLAPLRTVPPYSRLPDLDSILAVARRRLGWNIGFSYDLASFELRSKFTFKGDGWGLTRDDRRLIMSDGTSTLRFLDPETFNEIGNVVVTHRGRPIDHMNELEFVEGEIYANIWPEERIAIIHADSGQVTGWIDMAGLESRLPTAPNVAAGALLNGIAHDAEKDRLFVTGKLWPRLFEIRLRKSR